MPGGPGARKNEGPAEGEGVLFQAYMVTYLFENRRSRLNRLTRLLHNW